MTVSLSLLATFWFWESSVSKARNAIGSSSKRQPVPPIEGGKSGEGAERSMEPGPTWPEAALRCDIPTKCQPQQLQTIEWSVDWAVIRATHCTPLGRPPSDTPAKKKNTNEPLDP